MARFGYDKHSWKWSLVQTRLWLRNHSSLYKLAADATANARQKLGLSMSQDDINQRIAEMSINGLTDAYVFRGDNLRTVLSPHYRSATLDLENIQTKEGLRITLYLFEKMIAEASSKKIRFSLVIIPTKEMVYRQYDMTRETQEIPSSFTKIIDDEKNVTELFLRFCKNQGIKCYYPLNSMVRAMSAGEMLYTESLDGHPIASGYNAMAVGIAENL